MNLNAHDVELHSMYAAIPPYRQVEEENSRTDVSQIPYFVMAIALLVVFALTLTGKVPSYVLIVAWFIALSKCF